jgi:hypothetical protein
MAQNAQFYTDKETGITFRLEARGEGWFRVKLGEDSYWFTAAEFKRYFSPRRLH